MSQITKEELRKEFKNKRENLTKSYKHECSKKVVQKLWELILQTKIRILHSYIPMGSEVDIYPLLKKALSAGIMIIVPKTLKQGKLEHLVLNNSSEMVSGMFGTMYPAKGEIYTEGFDMILVPGLAFDKGGNRVGYGAGYYDIFLKDHPNSIKVGVCYPFQVVDSIPYEDHDVEMDLITSCE